MLCTLTLFHPTDAKRRGCWLDDIKKRKADSKRSKAVTAASAGAAAGSKGGLGGGGAGAGAAPYGAEGVAAGKVLTGPGSHVVLYRYNEGYTNAVKRPLLMRELLDE